MKFSGLQSLTQDPIELSNLLKIERDFQICKLLLKLVQPETKGNFKFSEEKNKVLSELSKLKQNFLKIINLKYTIGLALLHLHSKFTTLCYYSTRIIECIAINSEKNERVAKMYKTYFKDLIFSLVMSKTKKDHKTI